MKQRFLGLVFLLLLSACSTTKVHLFAQGIETSELSQISKTLLEQGFRVNLVELQPPDLPNATMIYSPALPNISDIDRIRDSLSELGYNDIDLIAVSNDNQSYTGRNIGLYLGGPTTNSRNELIRKVSTKKHNSRVPKKQANLPGVGSQPQLSVGSKLKARLTKHLYSIRGETLCYAPQK